MLRFYLFYVAYLHVSKVKITDRKQILAAVNINCFQSINSTPFEYLDLNNNKLLSLDNARLYMKYITALLLTFTLTSAFAQSVSTQLSPQVTCPTIKMNQISYYLVYSVAKEKSVTELFNQQRKKLTDFSKKYQLSHFNITSEDASVGANNYIADAMEVSFSFNFESVFDASLIDKVRMDLTPQNISFSVINKEMCQSNK